jgi:DNA-directed RNA polymerase subunit RPC12/RpoP
MELNTNTINTTEHWDVVENCPECGKDNLWEDIDPVECDYEAVCQECGSRMMLCDECIHADDNPGYCDWHECEGCAGGYCFRRVAEFETYPNMFINYDKGIENPDYDNQTRFIKVPMKWAVEWIRSKCDMTYDKFMEEYTWDETFFMYESALSEGVLISESIN